MTKRGTTSAGAASEPLILPSASACIRPYDARPRSRGSRRLLPARRPWRRGVLPRVLHQPISGRSTLDERIASATPVANLGLLPLPAQRPRYGHAMTAISEKGPSARSGASRFRDVRFVALGVLCVAVLALGLSALAWVFSSFSRGTLGNALACPASKPEERRACDPGTTPQGGCDYVDGRGAHGTCRCDPQNTLWACGFTRPPLRW